MSRKSSAKTGGPLSIGLPDPLNTRPSISSETAVRRISPVNSQRVCLASIPDVPSKTFNQQFFSTKKIFIYTHLNDSLGSADFQNLSRADTSISKTQLHNFSKFGEFDIIQNNQGPINARNRLVN